MRTELTIAAYSPPSVAGRAFTQPVPITANQAGRLALIDGADQWRMHPVLFGFKLYGEVDAELLRAALLAVVRRHKGLRYFFPDPRERNLADCANACSVLCNVIVIDLTTVADRDRAFQEQKALDRLRLPFDLGSPPLLRSILIRYPDHCLLGLAVDHTIFDGASIPVFVRDLEVVWAHLASGSTQKDLEVECSDFSLFARAEQRWLASPRAVDAFEYWGPRWDGMGSRPKFPLEQSAEERIQRTGGVWGRTVRLLEAVEKSREQLGGLASPFMVVSAALFTALHEMSGKNDLGLVFPFHGRTRPEFKKGIGYYSNNLLMRIHVEHGASFKRILNIVRETTLGSLRHAAMPYHILKEKFELDAEQAEPYLFLNMLPALREPSFPGLRAEFTWFNQDDIYACFPRVSVLCQSISQDAAVFRSMYGGQYERESIENWLERVVELLTS